MKRGCQRITVRMHDKLVCTYFITTYIHYAKEFRKLVILWNNLAYKYCSALTFDNI